MATVISYVFACGVYLLCSSSVFSLDNGELPTMSTKNVTAHFCPFTCTFGNKTLCVPPPCPPPACVDPATYRPTDCCDYCPHGPNCRGPGGSLIQYNHWKIVDGKNCTCINVAQDATCV